MISPDNRVFCVMAVKWLYFLIAPLGDADGKKSYFVMPFS